MPQRISWSNLFPGLAALAAVLLIAAGVLRFAGVGRIRGEKIQLYVLADQARGVMRGTEVWLVGQKIGLVDAIRFQPPTDDTTGRVVLVVRVRKRDAEQIRRDSDVQVRAGLNFIGPVVVYLTAGTPGSAAVREGDTLRGAQSDFDLAGAKVTAATAELGPLMADARTIMARARDPKGTVGALRTEGVGQQLRELRARMARLRQGPFNGNGHSASAVGVLARTQVVFARVDSIRTLLSSPGSSFGRFRRDSSLSAAVAGVRDEIAAVRATLGESSGTLGRLEGDSALMRSMANAQREMTRLFDDIRRRPLRYVNF